MSLLFNPSDVNGSLLCLPVFHPEGLDDHGGDDEGDAEPEGPVEFLQFTEDDGCESDAVNGFQVIG